MKISVLIFFLVTWSFFIVPALSIENIHQTLQCDGIYNKYCKISFLVSHPSGTVTSAADFVNTVTLPFNVNAFSGFSVRGANTNYRTACSIGHVTASSTIIELKPLFYFLASEQTMTTDVIRQYIDMSRIVECEFTFPANVDVFTTPYQHEIKFVELDLARLEKTSEFGVISTTYGTSTFPGLVSYPSINAVIEFVPTNGDICTDQLSSEKCLGDLQNLPTFLFPLIIATTHELILGDIVNDSTACPMLIEKQPNIANDPKNYYSLVLSSQNISPNTKLVTCHNLSIQKSLLSSFFVIKRYNNNNELQDNSILSSLTTPVVAATAVLPSANRVQDNQSNGSSLSSLDSILYQNYYIKSSSSSSSSHIETNLLADCADHTDSRCTFLFIFPFTQDSSQVYGTNDFSVDIQYLDEGIFLKTSQHTELRQPSQNGEETWLTPVFQYQYLHKPYPCTSNDLYNQLGLSHPNNYVLCQTFRKSLQNAPNTVTPPQIGATSGVKSQLFKISFQGEYLFGQYILINFSSQISTSSGPLALTTVDPVTFIIKTSMLRYTTPVEVIWDKTRCEDGNDQFCVATYRSKHIGGPLTIDLLSTNTFLQRYEIFNVTCNSQNFDIDISSHIFQFPSPSLISHSTTSSTTDTYLVTLADPNDPTMIKQYKYHECIVQYMVPYSTDNIYHQYNNNTDTSLDSTNAAFRDVIIKPDALFQYNKDIKQYINTINNTIIDSTQNLTFFTSSTLYPFFDINLQDYIDNNILPITVPQQWVATSQATTITNLNNFIQLQLYQEKTLVPRINTIMPSKNFHSLSHLPLLSLEIEFIPVRDSTATTEYDYVLRYTPLTLRYHSFLYTITKADNCIDKLLLQCAITFTYPSLQWLDQNQPNNQIRPFSIFIDGSDYDQILNHDFTWSTAAGALYQSTIEITATGVSYNDLVNSYKVTPVKPVVMPEPFISMYFVTKPTFDQDKKQFMIFNINFDQHHTAKNIPFTHDNTLEQIITLSFRKKTQFYFSNEYKTVNPSLISTGANYDPARISTKHRVLSQPPSLALVNLASQFQPDYSLEFDEICEDPYASQCRVFIHRSSGVDEKLFYSLDLKTFAPVGVTAFTHPDFDNGETRIYASELKKEYSIVVPLSFTISALDPPSHSATIRILQFASDPTLPRGPDDPLPNLDYVYSFYSEFPYNYPPVPVLQDDCQKLSKTNCSISYTMFRPLYAPLVTDENFVLVQHNLTSKEYFYVEEYLLLLNGAEKTTNDYTFSWVPRFEVLVDGIRDATLENKLVLSVKGSKHPNHLADPLTLTIAVDYTKMGPSPLIWFAGPTRTNNISIVVHLTKAGIVLTRQISTRPTRYSGEPMLRVPGVKPVKFPAGIGYQPISFTTGPNCRQSQLSGFDCQLELNIRATPEDPVYDATRCLYPTMPPHTALAPTIVFYYTIPLPIQITSRTDPAIRALYSKYECANMTQIQMSFDADDNGQTVKVSRFLNAVYINEAYQTKSTKCYINLRDTSELTIFWGYLLSGAFPWLKQVEDLYAMPFFPLSYYLNKRYFYPPDYDTFYNGFQYLITDDNLPSLKLPEGKSIEEFKQQFLNEIHYEALPTTTWINDLPQLPQYYPRFTLTNSIHGPAFHLLQLGSSYLPEIWVENIKPFATGELAMPADITSYGESNDSPDQQYVLFKLDFTTHIVDFHFDNEMGYSDDFYPCIEQPAADNLTNQTERFLTVDEYLMYKYSANQINTVKNSTTIINNGNLDEIIVEELHFEDIPKPINFSDELLQSIRVTGLFRYGYVEGYTKMFINPHYLTSQLATSSKVASGILTRAKKKKAIQEYLDHQIDTDYDKPTLRDTNCYYYAPLTRMSPRSTMNIVHTATIFIRNDVTVLGENENFDVTMSFSYPKYVNNAAIKQTTAETYEETNNAIILDNKVSYLLIVFSIFVIVTSIISF